MYVLFFILFDNDRLVFTKCEDNIIFY